MALPASAAQFSKRLLMCKGVATIAPKERSGRRHDEQDHHWDQPDDPRLHRSPRELSLIPWNSRVLVLRSVRGAIPPMARDLTKA